MHDLLHRRLPNHSRLFKALMTAHLPGWRSEDVARRSGPAQMSRTRDTSG